METKLFVSRSLHTVSLFAFLSLCQLAASVSFMLWSCVPLFLCRCIVKIFPALQIYLVAVLFLLFILSLVESLCSCTYLLTYLLSCNVRMCVQCVRIQHSIHFNLVCHTVLAVSLHAQVCYIPTGGHTHKSSPSKWSCCMCITGTVSQYVSLNALCCDCE